LAQTRATAVEAINTIPLAASVAAKRWKGRTNNERVNEFALARRMQGPLFNGPSAHILEAEPFRRSCPQR
jgi:hypothetical protein